MRIVDVIWLEEIVEKIQTKHGVEVEEVEEVLLGSPEFRKGGQSHRTGEDLYYSLGPTLAGRHLLIVLIRKRGNRALILTAREMTDREKRGYRRRRK